MGLLSNTLTGKKTVTLATSADLTAVGKPMGVSVGVKSTDRVNRTQLEADYRFDPVIFNMVNKSLQMMMHAGFKITSEKAKWQKWYDDFFDNIGNIGEEMTIEEVMEYILQDLVMYGNSFVELIYDDKTGETIVDVNLLPEAKMDYAKNSRNEVAIDAWSRPIGYVMNLPFGYSGEGLGDKIPEEYKKVVSVGSNQIFFLPKRIAHFKLFTYGERFYGIGLIEPAHQSSYRKSQIETARANEIYTRGANTIIAEVGDETHEAGAQELNDVLEQISNFRHDRYFAFPKWVKINTLPIDQNEAVDNTLKYLTVQQATSAGMPLAFATGLGEATNRATLSNQQQILELSLEGIISKLSAAFDKFVLKRIQITNNIPVKANLKFGDVRVEEKNEKTKRLNEYIKNKVLAPEEVRDYAIDSEDVNEDEKAYDLFRRQSKSDDSKEGKVTESDKSQLSEAKLGQTVELGGGYYMPRVNKGLNPENLSDELLIEQHDTSHALWDKLSEGYKIGWNFGEIANLHFKIINAMEARGLKHITPVNDLDKVDMGV